MRYAHKISDELAKELKHYVEYTEDCTDLGDEIAILRKFAGDCMQAYSLALDMPKDSPKQIGDKANAIVIAKINLQEITNQIAELALKQAKIVAARGARLDTQALRNIAVVVQQCVQAGLEQYAAQLHCVNVDPSEISYTIGELISTTISGAISSAGVKGAASLGGKMISTQPTTVSAAELVREMFASVPVLPPDTSMQDFLPDDATDIADSTLEEFVEPVQPSVHTYNPNQNGKVA